MLTFLTQVFGYSLQHLKTTIHHKGYKRLKSFLSKQDKVDALLGIFSDFKNAKRMNVFAHRRTSQGFHLIYKPDDSQEIEVCT